MRYRAQIEYDGTGYFGFQRQEKDQPTVQSELERALNRLTNETIVVSGSGRTDRGVHALGQVISFEIDWKHGVTSLQRALNANLAPDIAVVEVGETESNFHPRFDAIRRAYRYHVYNAAVRSPLRRLGSWYVRKPLDIDRMNDAAKLLVGKHDFATFGSPPQGDNTTREVYVAQWRKQAGLFVFYIEANAFLYRMVRTVVGTLKLVGEGSWTIDEFAAALSARDRSRAAAVAPACGLYLEGVTYEGRTAAA